MSHYSVTVTHGTREWVIKFDLYTVYDWNTAIFQSLMQTEQKKITKYEQAVYYIENTLLKLQYGNLSRNMDLCITLSLML